MESKKEYRPRLTQDEMDAVLRFRGDIKDSDTDSNEYSLPKVLSAWGVDGTLMNIDEYCSFHGLPREDVSSYKLVSHTGTPYYNLVFREQKLIEEIDFIEIIDNVIGNYKRNPNKVKIKNGESVTRLIYTDTHIGMDTNAEGIAMYATKWDKESIFETLDYMCQETINNREGSVLYIDELGDFLDGWDGETVRKGHKLPQNMNNREAFETGLEFKMFMIERLNGYFDKIICNNICNDNHSGDFGAILNHSFMKLAEKTYDNVSVVNHHSFMNHYFIGDRAIVITHGKDKKSLKFGFSVKLDPKQIEKIDQYLKHNKIFKKSEFIEFSKGDSHQMLFDYTTSQDFDYMNYPALSPSSEWVQNNFKKGHRGFIIQHIIKGDRNVKIIPRLV
tara:strand:+ start:560 stop:1726 length:1167 start_codon:yes stop_codon:yes gene_type:complete